MAHALITALLAWVTVHPHAALAVVFAVAVVESLFLLGLLVPGALFMFAAGALVGSHALSAAATFSVAIIGTLLGDTASYLLGRHYRGRLQDLPGLARIPGGLAQARAFFARHGGKGIILGRLIGALRPVMPTIAGGTGLSPASFAVMELIAALLWAPVYIGPGMVFGAAIGLAAQVATRLAVLLLATGAIVWAATSLTRFLMTAGRSLGRHYAERLLNWSRRHRRLGLLGPALADPRQPEIPALAVAAVLLMAVVAVLYWLLWGYAPPRYPHGFDALVFYLVASLHNAPTNGLARWIAELGSPLIYLPFATVIGLTLQRLGNRRAAAHWAVAVGFSAAVTLLLRWLLAIPSPALFFHTAPADPLYLAGGGQDLILCATVYGLAGMIVAARRPEAVRSYFHSATIAGVVLIALARLYLGLDWTSDSVIGLAVAFVWINVLVLGYRRQRPRPVRGPPVLAALGAAVSLAGVIAWLPGTILAALPGHRDPSRNQPGRPLVDWRGGGYRRLPSRIETLRGRRGVAFNLQAAGTRADLAAALARAGWRPAPMLGAGGALRSLAPGTPISALPVLPRLHRGRRPALVRIHPIVGNSHRRWVLRIWPTGRVAAARGLPLWVGLVDAQYLGHELHMLTTARDEGGYASADRFLAADLSAHGIGNRRVGPPAAPLVLMWSASAPGDAKVTRQHGAAARRTPKAGAASSATPPH